MPAETTRGHRGGPRGDRAGGGGGSDRGGGDRGGGRSGGGGGDRGNRRDRRDREHEEEREELDERVIDITRVAKVVKGGRHFAFRTVVVVGDNHGKVGIGIGKSRGVPDSIRKGSDKARRSMLQVSLSGTTIPHTVIGKHGGAIVLLKPASPGTGVIAGGGVRAVLEAVGVRDILSKSQGSANTLNVAHATLDALLQLKNVEELAVIRGKAPNAVLPFWRRIKREEAKE